jgi:hypothetical protein
MTEFLGLVRITKLRTCSASVWWRCGIGVFVWAFCAGKGTGGLVRSIERDLLRLSEIESLDFFHDTIP